MLLQRLKLPQLLMVVAVYNIQKSSFVDGRSWRDIEPIHKLVMEDDYDGSLSYLQQKEAFISPTHTNGNNKDTEEIDNDVNNNKDEDDNTPATPNNNKSNLPDNLFRPNPSTAPVVMSSTAMTRKTKPPIATKVMTHPPSYGSSSSTKPFATTIPTNTIDPFEPIPEPYIPDPSYFNYDNDSKYGPGELGIVLTNDGTFQIGIKNNSWGNVQNPSNNYWNEFTTHAGYGTWAGTLDAYSVSTNMCLTGTKQSPIDLRASLPTFSTITNTTTTCLDHHEVRSLRGDYSLRDPRVQKLIQPNKLRIQYSRRPCSDYDNVRCQEPDPPHADFPGGWGNFADTIHVDVKVSAEHKIAGISFDAEMQIVHLHPGRHRLPIQSVLIRATERGHNYYFQTLLDAFQLVFNSNKIRCQMNTNNRTRQRQILLLNKTCDYDGCNRTEKHKHRRKLQQSLLDMVWDPYHPMLIPTYWYYRYDGSLTEPPCAEIVTWFVADKPMTISTRQLQQLQTILFTNVDETTCQKTSVHNSNHSVARPVRQIHSRTVYLCTSENFLADTG